MIHKTSARIALGRLLIATPLCISLVSCEGSGSSNGSSDWSWNPSSARLVGGIDGLKFSTQSQQRNSSNTIETITTTGVTDAAGKFTFGYNSNETCTTDPNDSSKRSCVSNGPPTYGAMTFSICDGAALPTLPGPAADVGFQLPAYTPWDFFSDSTAIFNMASVLLMANANSGDPIKTGIKISPALQKATCQDFNWASPNIQQDAGSLQTAARQDGLPHDWPNAHAVTDYLTKTYLCARSGRYSGLHSSTTRPGYLSGSVWGNFYAFVDSQGQVEGYMDFSGEPDTAPYTGPIPFSGTVTIAPGGIGSVSYTAPAEAPLPNMNVTMSLYPYGATGTWQTADGSMGGSTTAVYSSDDPDLGLEIYTHAAFPKYRFLAKDILYTRPGESAPEHFVLTMEVGYDGKVGGALVDWPPRPRKAPIGGYLQWHGSISGNTVSLKWDAPNADTTPTTDQTITLALDPNTATLTGIFLGRDGGTFITFTNEQPLQGCRL